MDFNRAPKQITSKVHLLLLIPQEEGYLHIREGVLLEGVVLEVVMVVQDQGVRDQVDQDLGQWDQEVQTIMADRGVTL